MRAPDTIRRDRAITYRWTSGDTVLDLPVRYWKASKTYTVNLVPSTLRNSGMVVDGQPIYVTETTLGDGVRLATMFAKRYSAKTLDEIAATALARLLAGGFPAAAPLMAAVAA